MIGDPTLIVLEFPLDGPHLYVGSLGAAETSDDARSRYQWSAEIFDVVRHAC